MLVIDNHAGNEPTILINDIIIHGSYVVSISDPLDLLCDPEIDMSDEQWKQVTDVYTGESSTEDEIFKYINHEHFWVRVNIAIYGNHSHREALINDDHRMVRMFVAKYGNKSQKYRLRTDSCVFVRQEAFK